MHDTTDPRAEYPADVRFVNQGPDRRIPGELGRRLALRQRLSAFKSSTPPRRTIEGSVEEGFLRETSFSQPGDKPFIGIAIRRPNGRWDTFRMGHRWDPNWGDANLRPGSYNPEPETIGGYFEDVLIKLNQKVPHIEVPA